MPQVSQAEGAPAGKDPSKFLPENLVGERMGDRYRLEELIGRGAGSVVYRAYDDVLDQEVCIKLMLLAGVFKTKEAEAICATLRNEARAAMQLSHPNILRVFTYETYGEREFAVMEFVRGETLSEMVSRRRPQHLTAAEILTYGSQLLDALKYAHGQGIVHNDIKPANIMLDDVSGIKICDFGLARMQGMSWKPTFAGTPGYMSPERIEGNEGDHRSDLYSLAATLYALGNGHTPFGSQPVQALQGHLKKAVPPSRFLPDSVHEVLAKAMSKSPRDRFSDAGRMLKAWKAAARLEAARGGAPEAPPGTSHAKGKPPPGLEDEPSSLLAPPVKRRGKMRRRRTTERVLDVLRRTIGKDEEIALAPPGSADTEAKPKAETKRKKPKGAPKPPPKKEPEAPKPRKGGPLQLDRAARFTSTPSGVGDAPQPTPAPAPKALEPIPIEARRPMAPRDLVAVEKCELTSVFGNKSHGVERFFIEVHPVTNAQYMEFLKASGERAPLEWGRSTPPQSLLNHPVVGVSLEQARRYAVWKGRRLPTNLEWELAARGDDGRGFPWAGPFDGQLCWGPHNSKGATTAVGQFATGASPWGCQDMVGNVWEWTETDPDSAEPDAGYAWVYGGSFKHSCDQSGHLPRTTVQLGKAFAYLGFRCAVDGSNYR